MRGCRVLRFVTARRINALLGRHLLVSWYMAVLVVSGPMTAVVRGVLYSFVLQLPPCFFFVQMLK